MQGSVCEKEKEKPAPFGVNLRRSQVSDWAVQVVCVTYGVDKQHALHDVPEAGATGIRQGVIHPLHYRLEEPTLVLCLEGQFPLYTRQDPSRNVNNE